MVSGIRTGYLTHRWRRTWSVLSQATACCLAKPSHYLKRPWGRCSIVGLIQYQYGGWFDIKMSSYQYRKTHFGDKTIGFPLSARHLHIESGPCMLYIFLVLFFLSYCNNTNITICAQLYCFRGEIKYVKVVTFSAMILWPQFIYFNT